MPHSSASMGGGEEPVLAAANPAALTELESRIGYSFSDRSYLEEALTHSSYPQESAGRDDGSHNERLEFLGDAVLGFLVSDELMNRFPDYTEGQLTQLKSILVNGTHLEAAARRIELGAFLWLGQCEERTGGRDKKTLLADGFEALIAAVYLDGGIPAARRLVTSLMLADDAIAKARLEDKTAHKSALQEWLQKHKLPQPEYEIVSTSGPAHRRWFQVALKVGSLFETTARGWTKKAAEQDAARQAVKFFHDRGGEVKESCADPATDEA